MRYGINNIALPALRAFILDVVHNAKAIAYMYQKGKDTDLSPADAVIWYERSAAAGNRVMAFGDYSYYWIADRQGRSCQRLNELYATTGQVGFLASERVDGKLILSEAVKTLDIKAAGK